MRKIFVIGGDIHYINWMQGQLANTIEEADLVVLTGGADISPKYYQQPIHPTIYSNSEIDKFELEHARKAIELGKHIIGICKGSQWCCVLSEGELIQHQPNPGSHLIKTYDGKKMMFTSTHHNAQYPFTLPENEYKILGWTENMLSFHKNGYDIEVAPAVEVEICFYPKIKALAIQPHPENMSSTSEGVLWLQDLLNKHMNNEL